jgi:hypothetical protein
MTTENDLETTSKRSDSEVIVSVKCGEIAAEFSGAAELVAKSVDNFLSRQLPAYSIAKKLWLNYSAADLVENFGDYVKLTPEGPVVFLGEKKVSDWQLVALWLIAQEIAFETGKSDLKTVSLQTLQSAIPLNPKTISSRLSELSKQGYIQKQATEVGVAFKITTVGIESLVKSLSKRNPK